MALRIFGELTAKLEDVARDARESEDLGFDGLVKEETAHDPFFPLLLAAEHTKTIHVMTGIAVGFARSPMILAQISHDLNAFSQGRFTLGIGSQIKAHIERRFSMPWSSPAARMSEMVRAIKAVHAAWYDGQKLKFEGEFYKHTLMTPMFTPTDTQHGKPRVSVAAVGPLMTETAGAVGDGMLIHPFSTEAYIRNHTMPNLKKGMESVGRAREQCRTFAMPFVITGKDEKQFNKLKKAVAGQLAFYASTPSYRPVLDEHGWGELQPELQKMTQEGKWDQMGDLFTDEMLDTFALVGEIGEIGAKAWKRFNGLIDDFGFASFEILDKATLAQIGADLKAEEAKANK